MVRLNQHTRVWVFDIDDTLYLERDYVRSGFNAVAEYLKETGGPDCFAEVCWQLYLQGVRGNIFDLAIKDLGLSTSKGILDTFVAIYQDHTPSIVLSDVARTTLANSRLSTRMRF